MEKGQKKKVVVIGGGTGTHTVLRGLKRYEKQLDLTAIVTMADSGGSTGRLRDEFGFLPVGDVRMALAALAKDIDSHQELLRELFLYRFSKGEGLSGHNFGNLLLVALTDILGSEEAAIRAAGKVLGVQGGVVPVTTEKVHLIAGYEKGAVLRSEHEIDEPPEALSKQRIVDLTVSPDVRINPKADLYTSVLANCVVSGMADALRRTRAPMVYVSNLMTKVGQTHDMGVKEHLAEMRRYLKRRPDIVVVNTSSFPEDLLERYAADGEFPVVNNTDKTDGEIITGDYVASEEVVTASGDVLKRSLIRHDSAKLADTLLDILTRV